MFKKTNGGLKNIKITDIFPDEKRTRKYFDEYKLCRLKDSIKENGIIEPLLVRRRGAGYVIITGERRLRAAKMAGMKKVPCIVYNTDDANSAIYTITENLQRCDLTFFEEAEGINRLITEYGIPHYDVAARLGIAQTTLSNKLRVLQLDEKLRRRIVLSALTERHARALIRVPESKRPEVLDHIITNALNLGETELYIDSFLRSNNGNDKPCEKKTAIGDIRIFSNSLSRLVDTLVSSGIESKLEHKEFRDYIEYRVRIPKAVVEEDGAAQLKIC